VHEAKTYLFKLLERVKNGEEVIIAKAGDPVAILSAFVKPPSARVPGNDTGKVVISPDFVAPLLEFDEL
jgi:antitoxin (DNA-binding transcriptional repressor) of toxin-antitoxin stability system